jgi:hypothetical protein
MIKVRTAYRADEFLPAVKLLRTSARLPWTASSRAPNTRAFYQASSNRANEEIDLSDCLQVLIGQGIAKSAIGSGLVERLTHRLKQCL